MGHPGDCGRVTPGTGSGEGDHPGDCECVTPRAGSGDCVGLTAGTQVWILYVETPCVLFTSECLVRSEISNV